MQQTEYTHVAFADESCWGHGRFRSIALVSTTADDARAFHKDLDALRKKYGKSEFKWENIGRPHGIALVDFFFQRRDRIRVDVLIWDMEDSRHKDVPGRDDKANFARMYYHLLHNVLKRRWPDGARWLICPDEQKEVDWLTLEQCLAWKGWAAEENLFTQHGLMLSLREFYNIEDIQPVASDDMPLVQLADLFAGLGTYSYLAFKKYNQWKRNHEQTAWLLDPGDCGVERLPLSKSDKKRLPILDHLRQEAGRRALQVSLDSSRGLCTRNPKKPLNFWPYKPQRSDDKAPSRTVP